MSLSEVVTNINVREFFIEVHHVRGNVSKFEAFDPDANEWVETPSVWEWRRADDSYWLAGDMLYRNAQDAAENTFMGEVALIRVTRYPELERELEDTTYHPSVPAWKIDPAQVEEFFNNGKH